MVRDEGDESAINIFNSASLFILFLKNRKQHSENIHAEFIK
jgi:hypothetical protein